MNIVAELPENQAVKLSPFEGAEYLEIIETSLHIRNQDQFLKWTQTELQAIFPHGMLICGQGRIGMHGVKIQHVIGCNFPDEYIQTLMQPDGLTRSPMIIRWIKEQQPILFEPECGEIMKALPEGWLNNFHGFGLRNLAAHGLCDIDKQTASYFSFSCIPGRLNQRHAYLLKLLVPHLHVALSRVISNPQFNKRRTTEKQPDLRPREKEILQWMSGGKSNWEIARVLGLSESTIKNHVHKILGKLQATSRAQAVSKAIARKLISAKH